MTQPTMQTPKTPPPRTSSNAILAALIGFITLSSVGLVVWLQDHPWQELESAAPKAPQPPPEKPDPEAVPAVTGAKEPTPGTAAETPVQPTRPEPSPSESKARVAKAPSKAPAVASFTVVTQPPVPVKTVTPAYPVVARSAKVQGEVAVAMKVNEKGVPVKVTVLEGPVLLRASALDAAKDWRFEPAHRGAKAVSADFIAKFQFKI